MANEGLFYKFLLWREKRIKEKHFILIISFIVGLCTAARHNTETADPFHTAFIDGQFQC